MLPSPSGDHVFSHAHPSRHLSFSLCPHRVLLLSTPLLAVYPLPLSAHSPSVPRLASSHSIKLHHTPSLTLMFSGLRLPFSILSHPACRLPLTPCYLSPPGLSASTTPPLVNGRFTIDWLHLGVLFYITKAKGRRAKDSLPTLVTRYPVHWYGPLRLWVPLIVFFCFYRHSLESHLGYTTYVAPSRNFFPVYAIPPVR